MERKTRTFLRYEMENKARNSKKQKNIYQEVT